MSMRRSYEIRKASVSSAQEGVQAGHRRGARPEEGQRRGVALSVEARDDVGGADVDEAAAGEAEQERGGGGSQAGGAGLGEERARRRDQADGGQQRGDPGLAEAGAAEQRRQREAVGEVADDHGEAG